MSRTASPRLFRQALHNVRKQRSISKSTSPALSLGRTSLLWEGDTFELPPEMRWDLPDRYLVKSYSDVDTPTYDVQQPQGELQQEMEDVLARMEEGYPTSQGSWTSHKSELQVRIYLHHCSGFLTDCNHRRMKPTISFRSPRSLWCYHPL